MLTIFAVPKPFQGHTGMIQRNAIRSWSLLQPRPDIVLFGDEDGIAETAATLDVRHEPVVSRNEFGTPLLSDLFARARQSSAQRVLCYVNADIILMRDFMASVANAAHHRRSFLMIGQRWDIGIHQELEFDSPEWEDRLRSRVAGRGRPHSREGLDYFVFSRDLFGDIPDFAIGRTAWDNWLVYGAMVRGGDVIDATSTVLAVHQDHDYGGRSKDDLWNGTEARRNAALMGAGKFSLADATHVLRDGRVRRSRSPERMLRKWERYAAGKGGAWPATMLARTARSIANETRPIRARWGWTASQRRLRSHMAGPSR